MYELDMNKDVPLILWNYVFETLSLATFDKLCNFLRFPIKPTPKSQTIAQDFVITFAQMRGVNSPFIASNNLLSTIHTQTDKSQILFQNVFHLLEQESLANPVYKWGINTHNNYDYSDVANLLAWSQLANECAVIQVAKNGILTSDKISPDKIKLVGDYWMGVYQNPGVKLPNISPPPFNTSQLETFYTIIFRHGYERLMLKNTIEQILSQPATAWDKFIYRKSLLGGWLSLEGKFRISLDEWSQISEEMEFEVIEKWAKQYIEHDNDLTIPIPNFNQE